MKKSIVLILVACMSSVMMAQNPVSVGRGSYASYVPLSESRTDQRGGCQAYQMEHRPLYLPDTLLNRLGAADGSRPGTLALPSNDWWTYGLINPWTGKIWTYPGWVEAKASGIEIGYPTYWEPTGCEMKWDAPLVVSLPGVKADHKDIDSWGDYHVSFVIRDDQNWVRTMCVHGSPLVWIEAEGVEPQVTNPDAKKYAVFTYKQGSRTYVTVALLTDGLTREQAESYAFRIPTSTRIDYKYVAAEAQLKTSFHVGYRDVKATSANGVLQGFLPHHYYNTTGLGETGSLAKYATPRGEMRLARGNDFQVNYTVHGMLPYFPAPDFDLDGFSMERMKQLTAEYAQKGTFGADTYWGGKGLTQMMHYMSFALQMNDYDSYVLAKNRLREVLVDWYTYTPGETQYYFAKYPRWGALVGMDPSYDSDTFNDHHFHYGYFVYASAVLCMLDEDFRIHYGPMAREVARDYANWQRGAADEPWFRTLDPYCGHSFAGGMGNGGNGNGQESSSEAMQGWGGVWMLGAALGDDEMLEAGIFGYTLEARATAEYWFDRDRRNIDYTKYKHPYCCNLTMQGVGWWTWFSGDPVWMHSIQWLPISPVLTNYLSEDLNFTRWDYTQMYQKKEVGDYEAAKGGLGDESGLGNVCLSYLSLFDPDSAARVYDRMWTMNKALTKNPDTGGITYWLAHAHRSLGDKRYDILADSPLATAYTKDGVTTFAVYNTSNKEQTVRFFGAESRQVKAAPNTLTIARGNEVKSVVLITEPIPHQPDRPDFPYPFPNIALKKSVTCSSEENAGTLKNYVNDGDRGTRWGSDHKDNEWIMIDLGEQCYVDYVDIYWETAYASVFRLELSADKSDWKTFTGNGVHGKTRTEIYDKGRYLRVTGVERATTYGTSIYELEAYGLPLESQSTALFGMIILPTDNRSYLYEGETPAYRVVGYDVRGNDVTVNPTIKVTETATTYTVTATQGSISATRTWPVMEVEKISLVRISPKQVQLPLGETQRFHVSAQNQFGFEADSEELSFVGESLGEHQVIGEMYQLRDTAYVTVLDYAQINLAQGKEASCSGTENEAVNGADKAVDGKADTRWSSRFQDNEWLEVNLGTCYLINKVRLIWEAAYATSYEIQISKDGVNYDKVYDKTGSTGGTQEVTFPTTEAVFVRLLCRQRATGYGSSLYELEVYGEGRCPGWETVIPSLESDNDHMYKYIQNGKLYIRVNDGVFDVMGQREL